MILRITKQDILLTFLTLHRNLKVGMIKYLVPVAVLGPLVCSMSSANAATLGRVDIIAEGYSGVVSQNQLISDTSAVCQSILGTNCNLSQLMDGVVPDSQPHLVVYEMIPELGTPGSLSVNRKNKRLIFMEGFDLDIAGSGSTAAANETTLQYARRLLEFTIVGGPGDRDLNPLRDLVDQEGYTVHYIEIVDTSKRVGANASYLERYLLDNNLGAGVIANQTATELGFIGWSMGGLIGRLALARIDSQGQESNVDLYVSYDTPHRGAFLPLSLEIFIRHLSSTLNSGWLYTELGSSSGRRKARGARAIYDQDSTRELLGLYSGVYSPFSWVNKAYALYTDPVIHAPHRLYNELRYELSVLGNYPSSSRLVAVSLGNPIGSIEPEVDISGTLFKSDIDNPLYGFQIHKAYVRASDQTDFYDYDTFSTGGTLGLSWPSRFTRYESAPGSSIALIQKIVENLDKDGDVTYDGTEDRVTFIPTLRAIDVSADNFLVPAQSVQGMSLFDAIYYPQSGNLLHSEMSRSIYNSLVSEIQNAPGTTPIPTPISHIGPTSEITAAAFMALY